MDEMLGSPFESDAPKAPVTPPVRSYGCTFGCGNPYNYIVTSVVDSTSDFLCIPCFLKLASQILDAFEESDPEIIRAAIEDMTSQPQAPMNENGVKPMGENPPVDMAVPEAFEPERKVITVDQLPPEFR